jgi:TPR repeat protein
MPRFGTRVAAYFGSPRAQLAVAQHLWHQRDDENALYWARKASKHLPIARVLLANWLKFKYRDNPSVEAEAAALVMGAAQAGCAEAQQTLASYYNFGEGVAKSSAQARRWCAEAARNGRIGCWDDLFQDLLHSGEDAPNIAEARRYADLALDSGYPQFHNRLQEYLRGASGA